MNIINRIFDFPVKGQKPKGVDKSIRALCFESFSSGRKPMQVVHEYPILNKRTVYEYHTQWKKANDLTRDPKNRVHYNRINHFLHDPALRPKLITALAERYHRTPEEIDERLQKPWGHKGVMSGRTERQLKLERNLERLDKALELVNYCDANDIPIDSLLEHAFRLVDLVQNVRGVDDKADILAMSDAERKNHDKYMREKSAELMEQQTKAVLAILDALTQTKKRQVD